MDEVNKRGGGCVSATGGRGRYNKERRDALHQVKVFPMRQSCAHVALLRVGGK